MWNTLQSVDDSPAAESVYGEIWSCQHPGGVGYKRNNM